MPNPSTFSPAVIRDRLSTDRLRSYLEDSDYNLNHALDLYTWNAQVAAAFLEDLGRLEVVVRNRFDEALTASAESAGLSHPWFDHRPLFPGRGSRHALKVVAKARRRATRNGKLPLVQSKVIVELGFGFWRFLCSANYHTSLWVPVLAAQFPYHPENRNVVQLRTDVEMRMDRMHFLRNRVAHHEPIHRRVLTDDAASILELARWICSDYHAWMTELSRIPRLLAARPS